MKKLKLALILIGLLNASLALADVDSQAAVNSFSSELTNIKTKLQNGSMSTDQAEVLLQAIQARQNMVIIQQNQEIINLLSSRGQS